MTAVEHRFRAPDGRTIAVVERGDPAGVPVLELHGTPGSRLDGPDGSALAGVRLLSVDRPGYGGSDRLPGRRVVDTEADVAVVIGALGLPRVAVTGGGGRGPHALAAAWALPHRIAVAECRTALAPADADGLDWSEALPASLVAELGWAREGVARLGAELHREVLADLDGAGPVAPVTAPTLPDLGPGPAARPASGKDLGEALRSGVHGWVDDDLALVAAWGFDPAEIEVPVIVRWDPHGPAAPHGAWLAGRIRGAEPVPQLADDPAERSRQLTELAARLR
ncbi:alpha/beta fold hydrolase [Amnibacterium endophyticum]|uniref:Alpha/beta fold hydrolase n=1 Tax=Amnibacterium endophyticum TaxID=2109337 RepID=A0ABW4LG92_9MICO